MDAVFIECTKIKEEVNKTGYLFVEPTHHSDVLNELIGAQKLTQISDGHRLLEKTMMYPNALYSRAVFQNKMQWASEEFFHAVLCSIQNRSNYAISNRINAVINRTDKKNYEVEQLGIAEYITEALYDNWWFTLGKQQSFRLEMRDRIKALIDTNTTIQALFPVFYLKPYSPIKNAGPYPDLAELYSLSRCYEVMSVINSLSTVPTELIILADGFKYQRACRTPTEIIHAYQHALTYWNKFLGFEPLVKVVDYEQWIEQNLGIDFKNKRELQYQEKERQLIAQYENKPNFHYLHPSLTAIKNADEVGYQLSYTFWSILSFVFYEDLISTSSSKIHHLYPYADQFQIIYCDFIASINEDLHQLDRDKETIRLFLDLRKKAWLAAIRYVAISLTDREINVLNRINNHAIKFTIHAKEREFKILTASNKYASFTAQHCTGGLDFQAHGTRVSFVYRVEREANGEIPIIISSKSGSFARNLYYPLDEMAFIEQPMLYINANESPSIKTVYNKLLYGRS